MNHNLVWIAALACGCGQKKDEPPPPPFTGALTIERVMTSKDTVKLLEPWDRAYAKLQAKLGKPQKVDGAKHTWAAVEGDACAYVVVSSGDGKPYGKSGTVVDALYEPMVLDKDGAMMNRAECLDATGFDATPEDPNAAGPPASGIVPLADFERLAVPGRAKWKDQRIQVAGKVQGLTTEGNELQLAGPSSTQLALRAPAPPGVLGSEIVAACTVKLDRGLRGDGTYRWGAKLVDCELVDAPPAGSPK